MSGTHDPISHAEYVEKLKSIRHDIIRAAFDWQAKGMGFRIKRHDGSYSSGTYVVTRPDDRGEGSRITYPDGEEAPPRGTFTDPSKQAFVPLYHAIINQFDPWFDLPDTVALGRAAAHLRRAVVTLNAAPDTDRDSKGVSIVGSNHRLSTIGYMAEKIGNFDGQAVNAFESQYVLPLYGVVRGQRAMASVLGLTLSGEQLLFEAVREDILSLARSTKDAMIAQETPAGSGFGLKVATAVIGAAALFATGGTAVAVGVAGFGLATLSDFAPEEKAAGKPARVTGESPKQVIASLHHNLLAVNTEIVAKEQRLSEDCQGARRTVVDNRVDFDLSSVGRLLNTTSTDRLGVFKPRSKEIKQKLETLRDLGAKKMPDLADELQSASGMVTDGIDESAWKRDKRVGYRPGGSDVGPYTTWRQLNDLLRQILEDTKWELVRGGEHLVIAARIMTETEDQVRDELAAHKRKFDGGSPASEKDYSRSPR